MKVFESGLCLYLKVMYPGQYENMAFGFYLYMTDEALELLISSMCNSLREG